jgi:hypothetical protein
LIALILDALPSAGGAGIVCLGYWLFGWRGAAAALAAGSLVWATARVIRSFDADRAEAALTALKAETAAKVKQTAEVAKKLALHIRYLEQSRKTSFAQHQVDMAAVAVQLDAAQRRLADAVQDRPSCDYSPDAVRLWNDGADAVERARARR